MDYPHPNSKEYLRMQVEKWKIEAADWQEKANEDAERD